MEVGFSLPARMLSGIDGVVVEADKLESGSRAWIRGGRNNTRLLALQSLHMSADKILDPAKGTAFESWAAQGAALIRPADDMNLAHRSVMGAHARAARETADSMRRELLDRVQSGDLVPGPAPAPVLDAAGDPVAAVVDNSAVAGELDLSLAVALRDASDPAVTLREHVAPFFLRDPADLSRGEWRHLDHILSEPSTASLLPAPVREPGDRPLGEVARALGRDNHKVGAPTRKAFARLTFALDGTMSDPARMRSHLDDLVMRNPRSLTGSDWARMDVLLRASRTTDLGFTVPSRTEVSTKVRELHAVLDGLTSEAFDPGPGTLMHIRALRDRLQPGVMTERDQQLISAVQRGEVPLDTMPEELSVDSPVWSHIASDQREAIGRRVRLLAWAGESPTTVRHSRLFLDGIEADLKHVPRDSPVVDDLARDIERLIARNRKRLRGGTPNGSVSGYANYPEFAELGRISSNAQLMARLAYPFEPARPVAPAADPTPIVASGGEVAW